MSSSFEKMSQDLKGQLLEYWVKCKKPKPTFTTQMIAVDPPRFYCIINDCLGRVFSAYGTTKKESEREASGVALTHYGQLNAPAVVAPPAKSYSFEVVSDTPNRPSFVITTKDYAMVQLLITLNSAGYLSGKFTQSSVTSTQSPVTDTQ
jgi:hypothetical protein